MPRDYYVSFRSEKTIAQLATRLRDAHGSRNDHTFNIIEFVERTLPLYLKNTRKGPLSVKFYEREFKEDDPAFVLFNPLTLHADTTIWADANIGEDHARFIIAHETGHIVLHDHSAKAFSKDKSAQVQFADDEHSAEWQANTFAAHFLVPSPVVKMINNVALISSFCHVPDALALQRVVALRREQMKKIFEGDHCPNCGNFSLVQAGTLLKCTTIGCDKVVSQFHRK